jgi:hypothetical protein
MPQVIANSYLNDGAIRVPGPECKKDRVIKSIALGYGALIGEVLARKGKRLHIEERKHNGEGYPLYPSRLHMKTLTQTFQNRREANASLRKSGSTAGRAE